MTDNPNILTATDGAVATVTISRPDALNALTPSMLVALGDALLNVSNDPTVRVVVLTGDGRAFSSGVDLKSLGRPLARRRLGRRRARPPGPAGHRAARRPCRRS